MQLHKQEAHPKQLGNKGNDFLSLQGDRNWEEGRGKPPLRTICARMAHKGREAKASLEPKVTPRHHTHVAARAQHAVCVVCRVRSGMCQRLWHEPERT